MASMEAYPDVLMQEIAKRLDYSDIQSMKLVCRRFNAALSDSHLWIELCKRDNIVLPSLSFRQNLKEYAQNSEDENVVGQLNFERIWVKNPFRPNLIPPTLSTVAEMEDKYGWMLNYVSIEEPPIGSEPHPDIDRCFVTSHYWGEKIITINLVQNGVPEWVLDHIRPRIIVTEMVAPRWDCASKYHMAVELLHECTTDGSPNYLQLVEKEERKEWPQWTRPAMWEQVKIVMDDYPTGVREIRVISKGRDKQSWAGNYGSKFANLQVQIEMPDKVRWLREAEFLEEGLTADSDEDAGPSGIKRRRIV